MNSFSYEQWQIFVFIFQMIDNDKSTGLMNIMHWASSVWNWLDAISEILYFIGFGVSFYQRDTGRIILAADIAFWLFKIAQFLRISPTLGPYVIMVFKMVSKCLWFIENLKQ